jgi:hypothetical protein
LIKQIVRIRPVRRIQRWWRRTLRERKHRKFLLIVETIKCAQPSTLLPAGGSLYQEAITEYAAMSSMPRPSVTPTS